VDTYVLVYWEQEASLSTVPPAHVKGELVVEEVCEVVTQQKSILAEQLLLVSQCNIIIIIIMMTHTNKRCKRGRDTVNYKISSRN